MNKEEKREFNKKVKENMSIIEDKVKSAGYNNYADYLVNEGGKSDYGEFSDSYVSLLEENELKELASKVYTYGEKRKRERAELGMMFAGYAPNGTYAEDKIAERERLAEEKRKAEIQAEKDARYNAWLDRIRVINAADEEAEARRIKEHQMYLAYRDKEYQMYLQGKQDYENNNSNYTPSQRTKDLLASNPRLNSGFIAVGEEGDKHIIPVSYLNHDKGNV